MRIELDHPKFSGVELRGGSLMIHSMLGGPRVLRENVQDAAVTISGSLIYIAAFLSADHTWLFRGEDELQSERLDLGEPYAGGGRLISDGLGRAHLFYFVPQTAGRGRLLRHQQSAGGWGKPQTVTANVFGEAWAYSAAWQGGNHLHLAYLDHKDRNLLYRVYDLETRLWSGAIAFSDACCSHPQFLAAEQLHLFWLEESEKTVLKAKSKAEQWTAPISLSTGQHHAGLVGFACTEGQWRVLWSEGGEFYEVPLGQWDRRRQAERDSLTYTWKVVGGLLLPVYKDKDQTAQEAEPAQPAEPRAVESTTPEELEQDEKTPDGDQVQPQMSAEERKREAQAQAAFMEQAFRTLQEWEELRSEARKWGQEWVELRNEVKRWRQEWKPPKPVDLAPLTERLERLERRCLTLRQAQEEGRAQAEASRTQLERELARLRSRVEELESKEKAQRRGFWWRVLGRA